MPGFGGIPTRARTRADDSGPSFLWHANYLHAFALLCGLEPPPRGAALLTSVRSRFIACSRLKDSKPAHISSESVRQSLVKAWVAELLLALTDRYVSNDELRMVNNWSVVQAYYALYHVTQALGLARGQDRPEDHNKTQKLFLDCWAGRSFTLNPWTLVATAANRTATAVTPFQGCSPQNCLDFANVALRTTRDDALERARRRKRAEKRDALKKTWNAQEDSRLQKGRKPRKRPKFPLPQLSTAEKTQLDTKLRAYSMLDYLYRLRIKTHYVDAEMLIEGGDDQRARQFYVDLRAIVSSTMLVSELRIARIVGRQPFEQWVQAWSAKLPDKFDFGIRIRLPLLIASGVT